MFAADEGQVSFFFLYFDRGRSQSTLTLFSIARRMASRCMKDNVDMIETR